MHFKRLKIQLNYLRYKFVYYFFSYFYSLRDIFPLNYFVTSKCLQEPKKHCVMFII